MANADLDLEGGSHSGAHSDSTSEPLPRRAPETMHATYLSDTDRRLRYVTPMPRSVKEKRGKARKYEAVSDRNCNWRIVLVVIIGFLGTYGVLFAALRMISPAPTPAKPSAPQPLPVRVLHLNLAGSQRRARYGVSMDMAWTTFLEGCKDRLLLSSVTSVETSDGHVIRSVEDLIHRDQLVVRGADNAAAAVHAGARGVEGASERPATTSETTEVEGETEGETEPAAGEAGKEIAVGEAAGTQMSGEQAAAARRSEVEMVAAREAEAARVREAESAMEVAEGRMRDLEKRMAAVVAAREAGNGSTADGSEQTRGEARPGSSVSDGELGAKSGDIANLDPNLPIPTNELKGGVAVDVQAMVQAQPGATQPLAAPTLSKAPSGVDGAVGTFESLAEERSASPHQLSSATHSHTPPDGVIRDGVNRGGVNRGVAPVAAGAAATFAAAGGGGVAAAGDAGGPGAAAAATAATASGAADAPTDRSSLASPAAAAAAGKGGGSSARKAVHAWDVDDVLAFFAELRLTQYAEAILTNEVDGAMLLECEKDAEALGELGITSKLHISKIRGSLKMLLPGGRAGSNAAQARE